MRRGPNTKKMTRLKKVDLQAMMLWYSRGYQCRDLAQEFDVDFTTVAWRGRQFNVGVKARNYSMTAKISPMEVDLIAYNYFQGFNGPELARDYGLDRTRVNQIAKSKNVICPKITCDEKVFDKIEDEIMDEETPYWIGFLLADGCVSYTSGSPSLYICLQARDRQHLVKFRRFMKSNAKISYNKSNNSHSIFIVSAHVVETLAKYGIRPNKSHNAECDERLICNPHFWRGLIDGDGCIGEYSFGTLLQLTGTEKVVMSFRNYITMIVGKYNKIKELIGCWETKIQGKTATQMVQFLYKDSTIYLDRKKILADRICLQGGCA
jgi:hypothetical protein